MKRLLVLGVVVAGLALTGCTSFKGAAPACSPSPNFAREVLDAVNTDRAVHGLAPVAWDQRSADFATYWSGRMATDAGVRHSTTSEQTPWGSQWFENIARWPGCPTAADVELGWMLSPDHRERILDPGWSTMGVGFVHAGGVLYIAQEFDVAGFGAS